MAYGYSKYSLPFSIPLIPGHIFARTPERGDVVVFKAPPQNKDDWIKRVIGLPVDTIKVRGGIVWINGKPMIHTMRSEELTSELQSLMRISYAVFCLQ